MSDELLIKQFKKELKLSDTMFQLMAWAYYEKDYSFVTYPQGFNAQDNSAKGLVKRRLARCVRAQGKMSRYGVYVLTDKGIDHIKSLKRLVG